MKHLFKIIIFLFAGLSAVPGMFAQNVSLNILVLNSGQIQLGGTGTLQATINATTGTAGQVTPVVAGKINLSITVPPSLIISATQNGLPAGWTIRNNDGVVINLCNSSTTLAVNAAANLLINLQGAAVTSGAPSISGQITFKTNCTAPGSLSGDNPSDNSGQAGYSVTSTPPLPLTLSSFNGALINCKPVLKWTTENEINSDHFEIERKNQYAADWINVGLVAANGNTNTNSRYNFSDDNLQESAAKFLYRLKMVDADGRYKYSGVLPVLINCKTSQLIVYPNPVQQGILYVSITAATALTNVTLLSASGQVILKKQLINGTNTINVSTIANGTYVLSTGDENGTGKKIKVIIQH